MSGPLRVGLRQGIDLLFDVPSVTLGHAMCCMHGAARVCCCTGQLFEPCALHVCRLELRTPGRAIGEQLADTSGRLLYR